MVLLLSPRILINVNITYNIAQSIPVVNIDLNDIIYCKNVIKFANISGTSCGPG